MIIKKISIRNFKKFEELTVELSPFDCLVGSNNSGKSTLLQSLALFDFVLHNCLSVKPSNGNPSNEKIFEIKNRSIAPEEFVVLPVANAIDLWTDKIAQKGGKHVIIEVEVEFNSNERVKACVDLNFNRYSLSLFTETNQDWLKRLAVYKISYLPVFSTFLTQEEKRTQAVIEDALSRGRVNSVIRNLLFDLKKKDDIRYLENVLQNSVPAFKKLNISFDEITDKYIEVTYHEENKRKSFDLFMAGSGFQQFVYLFGFIRLRYPDLILLDEPDVHLHGSMQGALVNELKRLVKDEGKQIIFATHSRDIINKLDPDHIISLNEEKANRLKINFDIYDLLENLGSFDNLQIAQLQEFKRLLVVEDFDDWRFIQVFGKKVLGDSDWQKIEKRIAICPAKGNPVKQDMIKLKDQLTSMFRMNFSGNPLKLLILADWDYMPFRDDLQKKLNEKDPNIKYYIWKKAEIENYLLVTDAIKRIVNDNQNDISLITEVFINEFNRLVDESKGLVLGKVGRAIEEFSKNEKRGWDFIRIKEESELYMNNHWETNKLSLVDAKSNILPGLKKWLQSNLYSQFSDLTLAENLKPEEIHPDIFIFINELAKFSGFKK